MTKRTVPPTAKELQEHVQQIAKAFHIALIEDVNVLQEQGTSAHMLTPGEETRRLVIIHPVVDETSYAVAMHELGHCLHPNGLIDATGTHKMLQEESAWEWAEYASLDWTVAMEQVKKHGLESYRRDAERQVAAKLQEQKRAGEIKRFIGRLK